MTVRELQFLTDIIQEERKDNAEFRGEVLRELSEIKRWIAVEESKERAQTAARDTRNKVLAWSAGALVTILSVVIPLILSR